MKSFLFLLITLIVMVPGFCREHEKIIEKVDVTWWQVPVFAVDKDGNAVMDLNAGDIDLYVNNRPVKAFTLYKRSFSVTQKEQETKFSAPQPAAGTVEKKPAAKKKVVFLLFDVTLSDKLAVSRSKRIAETVIMRADKDTRFIILTIEPFVGLNYIGEALNAGNGKNKLMQILKEKVIERTNLRYVNVNDFIVQMSGRGGSAFTGEELAAFKEPASKHFQRKFFSFFYAFETLYFYLNSMEENKFVYFFCEGLSRSVINSSRGGTSMYNYFLEKTADYLGRCGAVLFIVNSMGVTQPMDMTIAKMDASTAGNNPYAKVSGEDSLRYLARESGGKYLEGVKEDIAKKLESMYRAYYEISFPDIPGAKGSTRKITVKAKRKGITIHSLRSLEKRKRYEDMESLEKELLALNLITGNPMFKARMPVYSIGVDKIKRSKKKVVYRIKIPDSYLNKTVDLYKFQFKEKEEVLEVARIEKESLRPQKNKMKIEFKIKGDSEPVETYFVLVNGKKNTALVRGMVPVGDELAEGTGKAGKREGEGITSVELQEILAGAASYCEKLKTSAFHFICKENISETRQPWPNLGKRMPEITKLGARDKVVTVLDKMRQQFNPRVKSYVYSYRLIKRGAEIKEEREWVSSSDHVRVDRNKVIRPTHFFSEKSIFAPATVFVRERQGNYRFRFIRYDTCNSRPVAVIEAIPREEKETVGIYGVFWIDREDFSVIKIEAEPRSIRGYSILKDLAKRLRTKLYLSLDTEFNRIYGGIRFPTKVNMLEKYKGGRNMLKYWGAAGWERSHTVFTYDDYQFFDVQTEVTVHE